MKHAHVKLGEYEIPLIGIKKSATEEICDTCKKTVHIDTITITEDGKFLCEKCLL